MFAVDVDLSDARGLTCRCDNFFQGIGGAWAPAEDFIKKKQVHARLIQQNKAERRRGKIG
jgi:hypothetical protein